MMNFNNLKFVEEKFTGRRPDFVGKHKSFSVLIPLVRKEEKLYLLYEVRNPKLEMAPGEISFPGGAIEDGETPLAAAIRETMEELGIPEEDIKIIAKEGRLQTHSNILIHCYLGVIEIDKLCINDDEVAEVFTVPIDFFMENEPDIEYVEVIPRPDEHFPYEKIHFPNGYKWAKGCNEIPIYNFEGRPIWRITARITHDFIRVMKGEKK